MNLFRNIHLYHVIQARTSTIIALSVTITNNMIKPFNRTVESRFLSEWSKITTCVVVQCTGNVFYKGMVVNDAGIRTRALYQAIKRFGYRVISLSLSSDPLIDPKTCLLCDKYNRKGMAPNYYEIYTRSIWNVHWYWCYKIFKHFIFTLSTSSLLH